MIYSFPKWTNKIKYGIAGVLLIVPAYAIALIYYAGSPETLNVGYAPEQPIAYSHALHAGELAIDCLYCHNTVEKTAQASIPSSQTCMNCHAMIRTTSDKILPIKESYESGMPIEWIRVHDSADYAYFNHSAHITRGIGCVSCHDRVDQMEIVYQAKTLSMGWCLDCHRNPEQHLRPVDQVTNMTWTPEGDQLEIGTQLREQYNINPSTDCSTCHR